MKMLRSVIERYEDEFKNEFSQIVIDKLNNKQKLALNIILENPELDDFALNKKMAQELYNNVTSYSSYKSFKKSFQRVIFKIVYLHVSNGSQLQKIFFELQEEIVVIKKLNYFGMRSAAKVQYNKTLSKALKYQNFEVAKTISLIIIEHYAFYGKENQLTEIISKYEKLDKICKLQTEIKILYGYLIKKKNISDKDKERHLELLNEMESKLEFDSWMYRCFYFFIKLIICKKEKYEIICRESIEYFSNLPFNHSAYISIFRNRLLNYKIANGDLLKSKLVLKDQMNDYKIFTYHWYIYALTYVRVLLYAGDTSEAYKWYKKVADSRNYITLPKDHRNEWEVLGMYVYLMADNMEAISIRKVKYNLNYNKTERSKNNINFLIAELIYDIKSGKLDIDKK